MPQASHPSDIGTLREMHVDDSLPFGRGEMLDAELLCGE
jgi:hypothetical protein